MKVDETPGRLVVRDNPWPFWAFYSVFPLMGLAVLYLAWAKSPDEITRLIASVIGFAHLGGVSSCFGSSRLRSSSWIL